MLLQFMEENTEPVFFIFTANDMEKMSPAIIDRFEGRFFVDLPDEFAREEIISLMLYERKKAHLGLDSSALANGPSTSSRPAFSLAAPLASIDEPRHRRRRRAVPLLTVAYAWAAWVTIKQKAVRARWLLKAYVPCGNCLELTPSQGQHCMNCGAALAVAGTQ